MGSEREGESLAAALGSARKRSVTAQLKPWLPAVEKALAEGARRDDVVAALQSQGILVTLGNLKKALTKYRKEMRSGATLSDPLRAALAPAEQASPAPVGETDERREPPVDPATAERKLSVAELLNPARRDAYTAEFMNVERPSLLRKHKKDEG